MNTAPNTAPATALPSLGSSSVPITMWLFALNSDPMTERMTMANNDTTILDFRQLYPISVYPRTSRTMSTHSQQKQRASPWWASCAFGVARRRVAYRRRRFGRRFSRRLAGRISSANAGESIIRVIKRYVGVGRGWWQCRGRWRCLVDRHVLPFETLAAWGIVRALPDASSSSRVNCDVFAFPHNDQVYWNDIVLQM